MRVNLYIRNEDLEKWKALPNKSEFVHEALSRAEIKSVQKRIDTRLETLGDEAQAKLDKLKSIPGVTTASQLKEPNYEPMEP